MGSKPVKSIKNKKKYPSYDIIGRIKARDNEKIREIRGKHGEVVR